MDRIIEVKVNGNYLSKDNKNAGVRGEANVTRLRITFEEGWDDYTKKITFWDARGLNPVTVVLLPELAENENTYLVPIPAEPMAEAGALTFVIQGTVDDRVQRSISDKLEVKNAPIAQADNPPASPTEDELTQLEGEIEQIKGDILLVRNAKEDTQKSAESASGSATNAARSANLAANAMLAAQEAVGKTSYIGKNGNWYAWDGNTMAFYDTGVKATAGDVEYTELGVNADLDNLDDGWYHLPDGHNSFDEALGHNYPHTLYQTSAYTGYTVQIAMCPQSIMWRGEDDGHWTAWKNLSLNVIDNLTSTNKTSALSANQGKVLDEKVKAIQSQIGDIATLLGGI